MKNKKTIFIIATAAFTVLFAFLAVFVISRKKYSFPLYEDKLNRAVVGDSLFCNEGSGANLAVFLEQETGCEMQNCSIGGTSA